MDVHDAMTVDGARRALASLRVDQTLGYVGANMHWPPPMPKFEDAVHRGAQGLAEDLSVPLGTLAKLALGGDPAIVAHRECTAALVRILAERGVLPEKKTDDEDL